ncbi:MAG: hypothetical protein JXB32_00875 [Deltaproteobacteria bacterium]|nr:hypothetical protein [Deltaproteobacteria bacterium]
MFGFACRSVHSRGPWPWTTAGGGPAGDNPARLPRGVLGGQTVVLLTVWAVALVCGVALAGPPGGGSTDVVGAVPAAVGDAGTERPAVAADPAPRPAATGTAPERSPRLARPSGPADAGSDAADLEGDRAFEAEGLRLE